MQLTSEVKVKMVAAALDALRPGWRSLVDVGRLDMSSFDDCVLGQVYGEEAAREGLDGFTYVYAKLEVLYEVGWDVVSLPEFRDLWVAEIMEGCHE